MLEGAEGGWGGFVVGDPCVVRDEEIGGWRMFLFALPPGHGQAVALDDPCEAASWRPLGALEFTNPEALGDKGAYKPFVLLESASPNLPARIDGHYALLFVSDHEAKVLRRAWSKSLAGPWTIEAETLIERGSASDFDARHVDAVSACCFRERGEILYFYMGYPLEPQAGRASPLGSAQGAAVETIAEAQARLQATMSGRSEAHAAPRKLGVVLPPSSKPGHWAGGWVGGLQLLPGSEHRWIALVNASPSAPRSDDESISREEPPPSLGGFAVCDEEFPVSGWRFCEDPIERLEAVPPSAQAAGEVVNFWRHCLLVCGDRLALFYNAGSYFEEKLFLRVAAAGD